jgi:HAUS augmin-like complex subunit 1
VTVEKTGGALSIFEVEVEIEDGPLRIVNIWHFSWTPLQKSRCRCVSKPVLPATALLFCFNVMSTPYSTTIPLSPTRIRAQQVQARDWNFVDLWLSSKLGGKPAPPFERNADTLKAFLALAAWNENADEEQELLENVKRKALVELQDSTLNDPNAELVESLTAQLRPEGQDALSTLARTSSALHSGSTSPSILAQAIISLTTTSQVLDQQLVRTANLKATLDMDLQAYRKRLAYLQSSVFEAPESLPKQTQDWQRGTKALTPKLEEYRHRLAALSSSGPESHISVEDVLETEKEVLEIRDRVRDVEARVKGYKGLPADRRGAIEELERIRKELKILEKRRDGLFEGLVEEESMH